MALNLIKFNSSKKAYFQIDIMFAGFLFFVFLSIIYSSYLDYFEKSNEKNQVLLLQSSAKDLCQHFRNDLITFNQQINSTTLSNYIDNNYISIKQNLGIENFNFNFNLYDINTNSQVQEFGINSPKTSLSQTYSCFISDSNKINQITIEVWK